MYLMSEFDGLAMSEELVACGPAAALRVAAAVLTAVAERIDDPTVRVTSVDALAIVAGVLGAVREQLAAPAQAS
jgi:hypothetical protein